MNPYLRTSLAFGTIAGLGGIFYFVVLQYWVHDAALTRMSSWEILITLACSVYAMGYYRDRKQAGILHFWQGALLGIGTALIATTLTCLVVFWLVSVIDPSIFKEFILYTQKDMSQRLASDVIRKNPNLQQMIRAQLTSLPTLTPFTMILFPGGIFVKNFGIELLVTGMIAAIMRKNVGHLTPSRPKSHARKKINLQKNSIFQPVKTWITL